MDTPAEPSHVFETDARGGTHPGQSIVIGSLGPDDRPLDPLHLCDQKVPGAEEAIAHTRRRVAEMVCTASMWFDGLFGARYYISESTTVNGMLELREDRKRDVKGQCGSGRVDTEGRGTIKKQK